MRHGIFITFEGGDGSGKSTQMHALSVVLEDFGYEVLNVREPGGTVIGERIRQILLDPANTEMTSATELFLYEAARAQIVREVIRPSLEKGMVVLCDRFFDSTVAYQGYGRGLPLDVIDKLNELSVGDCIPDRTILIEVDVASGLLRATKDGSDRLEDEGDQFHERVHAGFHRMAEGDERIRIVETRQRRTETCMAIFHELSDLFPDISPDEVETLMDNEYGRFFNGRIV